MNTPLQTGVARRGLHPLVAAAAVAVIVMCTVGVAAVMGWLPTPSANTNPNALSAESAALAGPEGGNLAPAPQIPAQPLAPAPGQQPAARQPAAPRPQAAAPAQLAPPRRSSAKVAAWSRACARSRRRCATIATI